MASALKRLRKDLNELEHDKNSQIVASPAVTVKKYYDDDNELKTDETTNWFQWTAIILGPTETPYENGKFNIKLTYPNDYPFKPPTVLFETPIYHPNVDSHGNICLDILKDRWSPAQTTQSILLSISSLLSEPNGGDPLDAAIGRQFNEDRAAFNRDAQERTLKYAVEE